MPFLEVELKGSQSKPQASVLYAGVEWASAENPMIAPDDGAGVTWAAVVPTTGTNGVFGPRA